MVYLQDVLTQDPMFDSASALGLYEEGLKETVLDYLEEAIQQH